MERFDATVQRGQFILDTPVHLPDGTGVTLDMVSPVVESFEDAEAATGQRHNKELSE